MLTANEAAKILGVSRRTVSKWCQRCVFEDRGPLTRVTIESASGRNGIKYTLKETEVERLRNERSVEVIRSGPKRKA